MLYIREGFSWDDLLIYGEYNSYEGCKRVNNDNDGNNNDDEVIKDEDEGGNTNERGVYDQGDDYNMRGVDDQYNVL